MNQWVAESVNLGSNELMTLANLILQKCSDPSIFFRLWNANWTLATVFEMQNELSPQSPASSSKSAPMPFGVCDFELQIHWALGLVHILPTSSSKSAPRKPIRLSFEVQTELSLQSCALFVGNFARSTPATAETETLLWRPQEPHRVSRPRVFSPVNSHASKLSHVPTWWWVVDMVWLTSWCEC